MFPGRSFKGGTVRDGDGLLDLRLIFFSEISWAVNRSPDITRHCCNVRSDISRGDFTAEAQTVQNTINVKVNRVSSLKSLFQLISELISVLWGHIAK